ncbi:MAG: hypothetical protein ACFBSC_02920 [Microcoleaceae cyanobacterium]
MISPDYLTQEFILIVKNSCPKAEAILNCCHIKVLECYLKRSGRQLHYLGIYYPEEIRHELISYQNEFKEIAEQMGLIEVVCINATRLVRDPMSRLKHDNPRFWLELHWIASF